MQTIADSQRRRVAGHAGVTRRVEPRHSHRGEARRRASVDSSGPRDDVRNSCVDEEAGQLAGAARGEDNELESSAVCSREGPDHRGDRRGRLESEVAVRIGEAKGLRMLCRIPRRVAVSGIHEHADVGMALEQVDELSERPGGGRRYEDGGNRGLLV